MRLGAAARTDLARLARQVAEERQVLGAHEEGILHSVLQQHRMSLQTRRSAGGCRWSMGVQRVQRYAGVQELYTGCGPAAARSHVPLRCRLHRRESLRGKQRSRRGAVGVVITGVMAGFGHGALLALWGRRTAVENGGRACRRLHARYPAHREADGRRESGIGLEDDDGRDVSTQRRVEDLAVDAVDVCASRMDDGGWRGGLAYFVRVREGRAPILSNAKLRGTFCRRSICAIACGVTTFVTTSGGR